MCWDIWWAQKTWHSFQNEQKLRRSRLHRLKFCRLCGQLKINNWILLQIWQWSNLGVYDHLNDQSRICSIVRCGERGFMSRLVGEHVSTSWLRLGSSCLQRQSGWCCSVEKYARYHFVRDCVISGKIGLEKISTTDNVADGMTKCLSADWFWSLRHHMGVMKNRSD